MPPLPGLEIPDKVCSPFRITGGLLFEDSSMVSSPLVDRVSQQWLLSTPSEAGLHGPFRSPLDGGSRCVNTVASDGHSTPNRSNDFPSTEIPEDKDSAPSGHSLFSVPLQLSGAEYLPYSLQMRATPGARDRDVSSAFFRNNLEILERALDDSSKPHFSKVPVVTEDGETLHLKRLPSFEGGSHKGTLQFVLNALFMSTISRLTGNSNVLEMFPEWKINVRDDVFSENERHMLGPSNLSLPLANKESVREFSMFLYDYLGGFEKNLGPVVSKQHERFIPGRFKKELRTALIVMEQLRTYFEVDVLESSGCPTVAGFLSVMHDIEASQRRYLLIQNLVRAFSRSGNYQMEPSLYKLFHQVVLDVEGYFPSFAGPATVNSVFPGSGGYEGLSSIHFDDVKVGNRGINSNKREEGTVERRLEELLDEFVAYFKLPDRKLHRQIVGLFLDLEGNLRWKDTVRDFDLCDIEHFCCKLYIVSMNSHPSRTISAIPQCCNYYSWPRPNPKEWDREMAASFSVSWKAFVELMKSEKSLTIPHQLIIQDQRFCEEEECDIDDTTPRELIDNEDDSPQNAFGMDEDELSVPEPENEENNVVRTGV